MSGQIFVSSIFDEEVTENLAIQLVSNISNITMECEEMFTEFICLFLFGLCTDNETLLLPSTEQCVMVKDSCIPGLEDFAEDFVLSIDCTGEFTDLKVATFFYLFVFLGGRVH